MQDRIKEDQKEQKSLLFRPPLLQRKPGDAAVDSVGLSLT